MWVDTYIFEEQERDIRGLIDEGHVDEANSIFTGLAEQVGEDRVRLDRDFLVTPVSVAGSGLGLRDSSDQLQGQEARIAEIRAELALFGL
ncbi:MAG: hypothetical protein J4432_04455 [DPANN group archaeon]|nr:hypothetical protein [DPANN group archaeon]